MDLAKEKKTPAPYFRNFVFGVEDSLVSTVGLLSGVAIAGVPRGTIFLTGVVLIFVEAFSMAAGSFLSEYSTEEYECNEEADVRPPAKASVVMFVSYFVAGFVPLLPYLVWETSGAFTISISLSLVALFLLGVWSGKVSKRGLLRRGFRMLLVGGVAILVGILAGQLVSQFGFPLV